MNRLKIAIVGATGMVGRMFLTVLEERGIDADYTLFASKKSAGTTVDCFGAPHVVEELKEDSFKDRGFSYALFSAGGSISEAFAPLAAASGAIVIDNSSCWRMDPDVPLVVPEVNPHALASIPKGIVANPNCSTIQAVVPLKALDDAFGLDRVVYSTYQAVSGAGAEGVSGPRGRALRRVAEEVPASDRGQLHPSHRRVLGQRLHQGRAEDDRRDAKNPGASRS